MASRHVGDITRVRSVPKGEKAYARPMELCPRMLGLDIGDRRVGVALSDVLGIPAPLLTMSRTSLKREIKDVARLVRRYEVAGIVAGLPLHMSGERSPQAAKAEAFAAALREVVTVPVYLQDERLSSAAAEEHMDRLGIPRGPGRKGLLDQYAAAVILQDWLHGQERAAPPAISL